MNAIELTYAEFKEIVFIRKDLPLFYSKNIYSLCIFSIHFQKTYIVNATFLYILIFAEKSGRDPHSFY